MSYIPRLKKDYKENASKAIMRVYEEPNSEVEIKDDSTPLTKADLAANKILTEGLKKLFPEIPIVSEENRCSLNIPKTNKVFFSGLALNDAVVNRAAISNMVELDVWVENSFLHLK